MHAGPLSPKGAQPAGWVTLGSGWQWPAALAAIVVGMFYLPAHHPSSDVVGGLVATLAALYLILLCVVGPRLVGGMVLRAGGSRDPIPLVGRGQDALTSVVVRSRWRLAAVAAGTLVPIAVAVLAARLTAGADPASYAHALANLALGVNLALAAGVLVPAPGFAGWALLLGLVDAIGVRPDRRIWQAWRVSRAIAVPTLIGFAASAVLLGDPFLMLLGSMLTYLAWTRSELAAGQDAIVRFLVAHAAGEIARPVIRHVAPDDRLGELRAGAGAETAVAVVEVHRQVIGAIGPRQLIARGRMKDHERCGEAMVPIGSLRLLRPSSAAAELLPEIARHGFALVAGVGGLSYVEPADLGQQIRIWTMLATRPLRSVPSGPTDQDAADLARTGAHDAANCATSSADNTPRSVAGSRASHSSTSASGRWSGISPQAIHPSRSFREEGVMRWRPATARVGSAAGAALVGAAVAVPATAQPRRETVVRRATAEPPGPCVELLWFRDCPNHQAVRAMLGELIGELAPGTRLEDIDATDPVIAERHRFPGSPTVRVDGRDVDPSFHDPGDYTPRCRLYWTAVGLRGVPERAWVESALRASVERRRRPPR